MLLIRIRSTKIRSSAYPFCCGARPCAWMDTCARSPFPTWVKGPIDAWTAAAGSHRWSARSIRPSASGETECRRRCCGDVVRAAAARAGIDRLAPHDLRRTCARLCHLAAGELDQIQFLLGHVSTQTTERYFGCKQKLRTAVNDRLGIEPDVA